MNRKCNLTRFNKGLERIQIHIAGVSVLMCLDGGGGGVITTLVMNTTDWD